MDQALAEFAAPRGGGLSLNLRVTSNAPRDFVEGAVTLGDGKTALQVRVRAIADKGAANRAVVRLIASWLGVAPSTVAVARGTASRLKTIHMDGDADGLADLLGCALETHQTR